MEGFTSLLIIASAFSVFGQYLDNNHFNEIERIKDEVRNRSLPKNHTDGLKEKWDNLASHKCLRARPIVFSLFGFLVFMLAGILLRGILKALAIDTKSYDWLAWSIPLAALFLICISGAMIWRLWKMGQEKEKLKRQASSINELCDAVEAAAKAYSSLDVAEK